MGGYCKSCYRDLPSDTAVCHRCAESAASASSPVLGMLLFAVVMTGMLSFDPRLCIAAAAVAVVAIGVRLAR